MCLPFLYKTVSAIAERFALEDRISAEAALLARLVVLGKKLRAHRTKPCLLAIVDRSVGRDKAGD
jgi:hypothetical protein